MHMWHIFHDQRVKTRRHQHLYTHCWSKRQTHLENWGVILSRLQMFGTEPNTMLTLIIHDVVIVHINDALVLHLTLQTLMTVWWCNNISLCFLIESINVPSSKNHWSIDESMMNHKCNIGQSLIENGCIIHGTSNTFWLTSTDSTTVNEYHDVWISNYILNPIFIVLISH